MGEEWSKGEMMNVLEDMVKRLGVRGFVILLIKTAGRNLHCADYINMGNDERKMWGFLNDSLNVLLKELPIVAYPEQKGG